MKSGKPSWGRSLVLALGLVGLAGAASDDRSLDRIKKEFKSVGATFHSTSGRVLGPGQSSEQVIVLFVKNPKSPGFSISYNKFEGMESKVLIVNLPGMYRDIAFERLVIND